MAGALVAGIFAIALLGVGALALAVPACLVAAALGASAALDRARDARTRAFLRGPRGPEHLGDLVAILSADRSAPDVRVQGAAVLAAVLPSLPAQSFYSMPFRQRYSLCNLLLATADLPLALALIDLFDRMAYPCAVMCLGHVADGHAPISHEPAVAERADRVLRTLQAALRDRRDSAMLLRPSSADSALLLRSMPYGPEPDEQLLRPAAARAAEPC